MKSKLKQLIQQAISEVLQEETSHLGEKTYHDYNSWKRACKQSSPNCRFDGSRDICSCISTDGKGVGEWDGEKGTIVNKISEESPCWKGYRQYGTKEKDGKEVPNCVPIKEENKKLPIIKRDLKK